ncbi:MAG: proton-conducting transporter membrane subunit [Gemmatimonadales bacterium]
MSGFFLGLILIFAGGLAAAALPRRGPAATAFASLVGAGCALILTAALNVLAGAGAWRVTVVAHVPGGDWVFGVDPLSAFFLVAIAVVGGATAVYGVGYFAATVGRGAIAFAHAALAVLLVALALVVTAQSVVPFLIALEVMAIAAFLLVMFEHEHAETRRAGLIYLAGAHAAILSLIAMFSIWGASAPDLTFESLARSAEWLGGARTVVLVLALIGFGLKAGFAPLHFWLPGAHASAPSHVSALMSGLVIKVGIYGLLRVTALAGGPAWFGWTLLALGVSSGVLGVVWALAQHDIKRLLAYHSVENIGIILIGMGAGVLGMAYDRPVVAALGFAGAILHVLNHALFKGLLFLGAGAVARATGTREMDALGALGRLMPVTWLTFLVASAAIVGLPPLNGFVSEWTIVQALLRSGLGTGAIRAAIFAVAGLGLIGGLALACFAKVNGVVFLGRARTEAAAAGCEAGPLLLGPMLVLAAVCVTIGLLPTLVLPPALAAARVIAGPVGGLVRESSGFGAGWVSAAAAALIVVVVAFWVIQRALMRGRWRVVPQPWSCGFPLPTPRMQYTASSFAAPVLEPFGRTAGLHVEQTEASFATHPRDPWLDGVMLPAWRRATALFGRIGQLQTGLLHQALLYVFATVVALLFYLVLR